MPINGPGDNARNKLLDLERRRQLAVVSEFEKIQTRLMSEISDILDRIDKERRFTGNASPNLLIRKARLNELLDAVTNEIDKASIRLAAITQGGQNTAIDIAQTEASKYPQLISDLNFFDGPATQELIGIAGDGQPLALHFAKLAAPARQAIFDALFFGIAAGKPNPAIAKEIRDSIGGTTAAAMTIVRTETNRAYREATRQFYTQAPAVIGWRWLAALDLNTCPICWALHGQIFKIKTKFGTHPNCRCTMVPVFADDAKTETGPEAFAKLNDTQKRAIIGPRRLELYNQGANLSDFVQTNRSVFGIGRNVKPIAETKFRIKPRIPNPPTLPRPPLFANSKVVNADGSLKVMVHGSKSRIDVFDLNKVRQSDLDAPFNGFWFTDNASNASPALQDPDFLHEAYLNIENPITRAEISSLTKAEPALRKLTGSEMRLELQRRGFDGVKWQFRPEIDAAALDRFGSVKFIDAAGHTKELVKARGGLDLFDDRGNFITGYLNLSDFLTTEYDEEIWVAFRPDQVKILNVTDLRATPPPALGSTTTPKPALAAALTIKPGDPVPYFANATEAAAYMEKRFPGTAFDYGGMDPEVIRSATAEMARLMDTFPAAADQLKYVGTYFDKTKILRGDYGKMGGPSYVGQHYSWRMNGVRQSSIAYNVKHFKDAKVSKAREKSAAAVGWTIEDGISPTTTHEFGHAVDYWLGDQPAGTSFFPHAFADGRHEISAIKDRITRELKPRQGELSDYAIHGRGDRQRREQFAEGFSQWNSSPVKRWARYSRAQKLLLEKIQTSKLFGPAEQDDFRNLDPAEKERFRVEFEDFIRELGLNVKR